MNNLHEATDNILLSIAVISIERGKVDEAINLLKSCRIMAWPDNVRLHPHWRSHVEGLIDE